MDLPTHYSPAQGAREKDSIQHAAIHINISNCIAVLLQGFMGVTSAGRGLGSTFFFELPVFGPDYYRLTPPESRMLFEAEAPQPAPRPPQQLCQPKPSCDNNKATSPRRHNLKPSSIACMEDDERADNLGLSSHVTPDLVRPFDDFPLAAVSETLVACPPAAEQDVLSAPKIAGQI